MVPVVGLEREGRPRPARWTVRQKVSTHCKVPRSRFRAAKPSPISAEAPWSPFGLNFGYLLPSRLSTFSSTYVPIPPVRHRFLLSSGSKQPPRPSKKSATTASKHRIATAPPSLAAQKQPHRTLRSLEQHSRRLAPACLPVRCLSEVVATTASTWDCIISPLLAQVISFPTINKLRHHGCHHRDQGRQPIAR